MANKLGSLTEAALLFYIRALGLPEPAREYQFDPTRGWRFDFAWPQLKVAAEVEGGTWSGGRHVRGYGFENDCKKYNAACLDGWIVLRFTTGMIVRDRGNDVWMIEKALALREKEQ